MIFTGGPARAVGHLMGCYFAFDRTHGDTTQFGSQVIGFGKMNSRIGMPDMRAASARYHPGNFEELK